MIQHIRNYILSRAAGSDDANVVLAWLLLVKPRNRKDFAQQMVRQGRITAEDAEWVCRNHVPGAQIIQLQPAGAGR